jgi:hypothetical protein
MRIIHQQVTLWLGFLLLKSVSKQFQLLVVATVFAAVESSEGKSKVPDWGVKSTPAYSRFRVDSGIGLPKVNVLESTLEWT